MLLHEIAISYYIFLLSNYIYIYIYVCMQHGVVFPLDSIKIFRSLNLKFTCFYCAVNCDG